MPAEHILFPVVMALAMIGYVSCLSRALWLTLAVTAGLAWIVAQSAPPEPETAPYWVAAALMVAVALVLRAVLANRVNSAASPRPKAERKAASGRDVVIDGTNVMYWDGEADLLTLKSVIDHLKEKGWGVFVFLDASSRHHLGDRSLDQNGFAKALGVSSKRIMVCPAQTEADAFILKFAREQGLAVVSNDRFGDRADQAKGLKLVKGVIANGRPVLQGL